MYHSLAVCKKEDRKQEALHRATETRPLKWSAQRSSEPSDSSITLVTHGLRVPGFPINWQKLQLAPIAAVFLHFPTLLMVCKHTTDQLRSQMRTVSNDMETIRCTERVHRGNRENPGRIHVCFLKSTLLRPISSDRCRIVQPNRT